MIVRFIGIMLAATLVFGCRSAHDKNQEEITKLEKELHADSTMVPDQAKGKTVIAKYLEFAAAYPTDTISPVYLFRAGDLSSKLNDPNQALDIFNNLVKKYPAHRNAAYALFLQGFICENQLGDPAKAKPYYEEFLRKYPDHPIASDVSFSLENLGKSPEELIKQFEQQNNTDTSGTTAAVK